MGLIEKLAMNEDAQRQERIAHDRNVAALRIKDAVDAGKRLVKQIDEGGTLTCAITGLYAYDGQAFHPTDLDEIQKALGPELVVSRHCQGMNLTHDGRQYDHTDGIMVHVKGTGDEYRPHVDCRGPIRPAPGVAPGTAPRIRGLGRTLADINLAKALGG